MTTRVLVVDDERSLLLAVSGYLTDRGYDVDCAIELEEAQALLANDVFDVVITDLRLSPLQQTGGLTIISFIRERSLRSRVIVLTAYATPEAEREAELLGVDLFLHKPAALSELARAIDSFKGTACQ